MHEDCAETSPCRVCVSETRHALLDLLHDYVWLHARLADVRRVGFTAGRRRRKRVAEQPVPFASALKNRIAVFFRQQAARYLNLVFPPGVAESFTVRRSYERLDETLAALNQLGELHRAAVELHAEIARETGRSVQVVHLPAPCPSCMTPSLVRVTDFDFDRISCSSCGRLVDEQDYPFFARAVLAALAQGAQRGGNSDA